MLMLPPMFLDPISFSTQRLDLDTSGYNWVIGDTICWGIQSSLYWVNQIIILIGLISFRITTILSIGAYERSNAALFQTATSEGKFIKKGRFFFFLNAFFVLALLLSFFLSLP